jgi:surface protein
MKKLSLFLSFIFIISCSKDPIIYTLTTSANPAEGGTVSPTSATFEEGQTATITASPSSDYLFQSWSGATGSTNSTSVVMNSDKTITANFVKKKFALTISVEGEGTVTEKIIKAGSATDYTIGSVIELTANPSDEWLFVEWKGDVTGTENPVEITIDKAKAVTAVFVKKQYPLTVEVEGEGTVAEKVIKAGAATDYNSGTVVELTATGKTGWEFKEWTGDLESTENPAEITIDASKTVKAVFVKKQFAVNITIEGEGGGSVEREVLSGLDDGADSIYEYGTELKLTAKPSAEWEFSSWKEDLEGTDNPQTITIDTTKTVTAVFIKKKYPLTVEVEGEGSVAEKVIKAGAANDYNSGTVVELTATGKTGWEFKEWTGDLTGTDNPAEITIDASKTVKAVFVKKQFAVNITIEGEGGGTVAEEVVEGLKVDSKYEYGTELKLTAKPSAEWEFSSWKEDLEGTENPQTITIDTIKAVTAVFIKKKYALTIEVEGQGSVAEKVIKAGAANDYNSGTVVELTASTGVEGWMFKEWTGDLTGTDNPAQITVVGGAKTVKAVFVKKPVAYLDDNGVTIKANSWAEVGDTAEIGGVTYTIVDLDTLKTMISDGDDVTKVVTTKVTNMSSLFIGSQFNKDISKWDVSNVSDMSLMFRDSQFNGDISKWDVSNVTNMAQLFSSAKFTGDISNWDVSSVKNMFRLFFDASFRGDISNWDVSSVTNMSSVFNSTSDDVNFDLSKWDVSSVTDMSGLFWATDFNGDISSWNVSNVTNMNEIFGNASSFNQDISSWNVSNVTDMSYMFLNARSFNQDISSWNVSNVTDMSYMFSSADAFNQDIGTWDVANVSKMDNMFNLADVFNQDLSKWCVSNITSEPTGFSNTALIDANKPKWGKCPIDTSTVTVTLNSTSISSTTSNGVTTTRYSIGTQINNNWTLPIEVTKVAILLPNGASSESEEYNGDVESGSGKGMVWSFNNQTSATITWTYKYEDVEYDVVYSWKVSSGIAKEESGDNSKLGVSASKN